MSNGLEKLRDIGAQTIHNETHISREYVQAMIHETFDGLQSVQFVGFVSILEREYNIDLSDLRAKGKAHFIDEDKKIEKNEKVFMEERKKSSNSKIYIFLGIIVVGAVIYMSPVSDEFKALDNTKIDNVTKKIETVQEVKLKIIEPKENNETIKTTQELVKENILSEVVEVNTSRKEIVVETKPEVKPEVKPKVVIVKTLKILPKRKIWAGYINIKTNQKYQKVFKKEFVLDTSKDWLLLFGMGTVKLEVNGEKVKFSSNQNMRFKYINGVFTKITVSEFKSLNKGRKW